MPLGSIAGNCVVSQTTVPSWVWWRKSGDPYISNTPVASNEMTHVVLSTDEIVTQVVIWWNSTYKTQFAVGNVDTDLNVSPLLMYLQ